MPDPWLYAIPALRGTPKAGLAEVIFDEYGRGRFDRMYSTAYTTLLDALGMDFSADHFESRAPWQYLATLNHQWMCALTPEYHKRLLGIIYMVEANSPVVMRSCLAAWARLGVTDTRLNGFYELNASMSEEYREIALSEVLVPLCECDSAAAGEIALGIIDARTLEAQFTDHLLHRFTRGESSLQPGPELALDSEIAEGEMS